MICHQISNQVVGFDFINKIWLMDLCFSKEKGVHICVYCCPSGFLIMWIQ